MESETYSLALKSALSEIQNICPDIKSSFMFTEDGEIIAGDEKTPEKTIVQAVNAFDAITEKGEAIGGVDNIVLATSRGTVNITHMNSLYLVTVASKEADKNYVNTITRVLILTVLKMLEKISPAPQKPNSPKLELEPEPLTPKGFEKPKEETITQEVAPKEFRSSPEAEIKIEPSLPEIQASQFIVENIGGLLVPSDTVRVDNETLLQWQSLYDDRKIEEVEIETFGGQVTQCKVKPIKDAKQEGKGIVQMPERIQTLLDIKKGELVRIKPKID